MTETKQHSFIRQALLLTATSVVLSGCLMGEEESKEGDEVAADNELTGSVGDGPIIGASLRVLRNDGEELAQLESDALATYNVTVRTKGKYYPLFVEARGGTDLVTNTTPDFDLLGAVIEPGKKSVANVNPFSTFAVALAYDLAGGVDKTNLQTAQGIVAAELNSGLQALQSTASMTTAIDSGNVAEIVRASEALGETVRRTRDALVASGFAATGNDVVQALAADLVDTNIDGAGGSLADPRYAAVWTIVSAQVLLETMANELHVNGGDATQLMNTAIDLVSGGTANPTLADLTVTAGMLERARIGLVAAYMVTTDSGISDLLTDMNGIQIGSGSSTVRTFALPSDYRSRLGNAIALVAGGSSAVLDTVNDTSRNRTQSIDTGPTTASVILNWAAPTQNEDGSALTNLAGYKIYWGTASGSYPNSVTINDANATSYEVTNLTSGTYEFVATSFNTSGVESSFSAPATKVVQ